MFNTEPVLGLKKKKNIDPVHDYLLLTGLVSQTATKSKKLKWHCGSEIPKCIGKKKRKKEMQNILTQL